LGTKIDVSKNCSEVPGSVRVFYWPGAGAPGEAEKKEEGIGEKLRKRLLVVSERQR